MFLKNSGGLPGCPHTWLGAWTQDLFHVEHRMFIHLITDMHVAIIPTSVMLSTHNSIRYTRGSQTGTTWLTKGGSF